jgi:hypothetical protein
MTGLPPGVYRAIARDVVIEGQWEDPEFLRGLMIDSTRIELTAGDPVTVRLTVQVQR